MAKRGINRVTIVGNLGQDPEVRYMPSGDAVTNVSIATSETWKDKQSGQESERTEWHKVVFFGKLAEISGEYLRKGSQVYIEGKLRTRKWQDNDGNDKYTTEIVVDGFDGVMQMLGGKPDGASAGQQQPRQQTSQQPQQQRQSPQQPQPAQGFDDFDDDIPF